MNTSNDDISLVAEGQWRIRAVRSQGEHVAQGEALVREAGPAHAALAGARAWHQLAQARLEAGDLEAAVTAARAGLDEIGDRYYARSLGVIDDTAQHISKANHQITTGELPNAARRLIRALDDRLTLYGRLHAAVLSE